jgi:hypothetical protein
MSKYIRIATGAVVFLGIARFFTSFHSSASSSLLYSPTLIQITTYAEYVCGFLGLILLVWAGIGILVSVLKQKPSPNDPAINK